MSESNKEMEFLSGDGKTFEIARRLANAVLKLGGKEVHVLRILQEQDSAADELARVLVRESASVRRSLHDIAVDKKAARKIRADAVRELKDEGLAYRILAAVGGDEYDSEVTHACVEVIYEEETLEKVGLLPRRDDSELAVKKIADQSRLLNIALHAPFLSTRSVAIEKLHEEGLKVVARTGGHHIPRSNAIRRIHDTGFLNGLLEKESDRRVVDVIHHCVFDLD